MNGEGRICDILARRGVRHVFGLPGSDNAVLFAALGRSSLETVVPTHELAAGFMACGYSRASGRVGVVVTTGGPGFGYVLPALAEARLDSVPLVHVVVYPDYDAPVRFRFQEIDEETMAGPAVKRVVTVDRGPDLAAAMEAAYDHALDGEPGPVLVRIPRSMLEKPAPRAAARNEDPTPHVEPISPPDAVLRVVDLLAGCKRPALLAGQGCLGAHHALAALAQRIGAVVLTSLSARGVIPEDDPRVVIADRRPAGRLNALLDSCDLLLALGIKLSHVATAGFSLRLPAEHLVHVDASEQVLEAHYPARLAVRTDVPRFLKDLLTALGPATDPVPGWQEPEIERWRELIESGLGEVEPNIAGVAPETAERFFEELRSVMPRDGIVVTDSGLHQMLTRRHYRSLAPRGLIAPSDFQSMGFGLPAAIGARLAEPGRAVACVMGDGGFRMCGIEIGTAVRENLPIPVIVFDDGWYGLIRLMQLRVAGHEHGVDLPQLASASFAAAVGARYATPDGDLAAVVGEALRARGPTLIDVKVSDSAAIRRTRTIGRVKAMGRRILGRRLLDYIRGRRTPNSGDR